MFFLEESNQSSATVWVDGIRDPTDVGSEGVVHQLRVLVDVHELAEHVLPVFSRSVKENGEGALQSLQDSADRA